MPSKSTQVAHSGFSMQRNVSMVPPGIPKKTWWGYVTAAENQVSGAENHDKMFFFFFWDGCSSTSNCLVGREWGRFQFQFSFVKEDFVTSKKKLEKIPSSSWLVLLVLVFDVLVWKEKTHERYVEFGKHDFFKRLADP